MEINVLGSTYTVHIRKIGTHPFIGNGYENLGLTIQPTREIFVGDVFSLPRNNDYIEEYDADQKKIRELCNGLVEYMKATLRHEIIHAFLIEAGLQTCAHNYEGAWVNNEEMIDWFANIFPKMHVAMCSAEHWMEGVMKDQIDEMLKSTFAQKKSSNLSNKE